MTVISFHASDRVWHRPSRSASILRQVHLWIAKVRTELHRRQTEKMLEALPADIRKDIGWPTSVTATNPE